MTDHSSCPCGSTATLDQCCGPCHAGRPAHSAEALMRSRYSAYVLGKIAYLQQTTLPAQQSGLDLEGITRWSRGSHWLGLQLESSRTFDGQPPRAEVCFTAHWRDALGEQRQHERSAFIQLDGRWYFIDPTVVLKAGRNDSCPCGSARKFKKCCSGQPGFA